MLFYYFCIFKNYSIYYSIVLQVVAGSGDRGWLDGSLEHQNWLKLIQTTSSRNEANMKYYLQGGQVCVVIFIHFLFEIIQVLNVIVSHLSFYALQSSTFFYEINFFGFSNIQNYIFIASCVCWQRLIFSLKVWNNFSQYQ